MNPFPMEEVLGPSVSGPLRDAEHILMLRVSPAQWWVYNFGIETMKSYARTVRGSHG